MVCPSPAGDSFRGPCSEAARSAARSGAAALPRRTRGPAPLAAAPGTGTQPGQVAEAPAGDLSATVGPAEDLEAEDLEEEPMSHPLADIEVNACG